MLKTAGLNAFWITSWPFARYVKHKFAGAWVCSAFRNEGAGLSSELIREAVAATVAYYGPSPGMGMVSFVDTRKVRAKRDPGYCYLKAGFERAGETEGGLAVMWLYPWNMPAPQMAHGAEPYTGSLAL